MKAPCVIFEDEHLLVVNKPAGVNTHAPGAYAGEGIYDWLRHREPRWAGLAIVQRLDKETSGLIVFSKTGLANRSLTEQFTRHTVRKRYLLLTDRDVRPEERIVETALIRAGGKYVCRPVHAGGDRAETRFRVVNLSTGKTLVEAEPVTGKTHQIRVHASAAGFSILGDTLYGGTPADRVYLHSARIVFRHPASSDELAFEVPPDFSADPCLALRSAWIDVEATNAWRLVHGASDGWPGWYLDRVGDFLLSQSDQRLSDAQLGTLAALLKRLSLRGAYHKVLTRPAQRISPQEASPLRVLGDDAPDEIVGRENGVRFALRFREGSSIGLFLDQRDNRRRFLVNHVAADFPLAGSASAEPLAPHPNEGSKPFEGAGGELRSFAGPEVNWSHTVATRPLTRMEVLNTFAHTCAFSVCAARAGARTTSLDLSKKYLDWGRRNFALNRLDPARHDFLYGDAFDWMRRLARKRRQFDIIVLDPPTFSQSKRHGPFRAEKDYHTLVTAALPLLKANGVLFASTNAAKLAPEKFWSQLTAAIHAARRKVVRQHYVPQPPDFPISREEPAYLKTVWLEVG